MSELNPKSFKTFGELLRHLRQRARLTQDDLGVAVGYSRAHIARLEGNQRTPDGNAVKARFLETLDLKASSEMAVRLIELAAIRPAGDHERVAPSEQTARTQQFPNNLPFQITSFVGREQALAELSGLLPTTRLLTLTGTGGTGKTRLALQLAGAQLRTYPDGMWLVELAPISDPVSVPQAVLTTFGIGSELGQAPLVTLVDYLRDKHLLIILDNCEHVIDACAQLTDAVLRGCNHICILATSREALGIGGELAWRVPSLQTPSAMSPIDLMILSGNESVRLFVERAVFFAPGFALTVANAPALQHICARLDGIPLAIELAAARVKALSPEQIAERLSDRFRLLTGGNRSAMPRQQTLQAMIDWSYRLLTEPERTLLRRLSIFVGGWTLEAAEFVCLGNDVIELLIRLVDKSLVIVDDTGIERRYGLLETIRQYALEKLSDAEESLHLRDKHLEYFLDQGKRISHLLNSDKTVDQVGLLKRLDLDMSNLRRALDWATENGRIEDGYSLLECYYNLFIARVGRGTELLTLWSALLEHPASPKGSIKQAMVYLELANLHLHLGQPDQLGFVLTQARAIGLSHKNSDILARTEISWFWSAVRRKNAAQARIHFEAWKDFVTEDPLMKAEEIKDTELSLLGELANLDGDFATVRRVDAYFYEMAHQFYTKMQTSANARRFGYALIYTNELELAEERLGESLVDNHALGDKQAVAACLSAYASLALAKKDLTKSARLFGASEMLQTSLHLRLMGWDIDYVERSLTLLRQRLDEPVLSVRWAEGRAMSMEQAMAYYYNETSYYNET